MIEFEEFVDLTRVRNGNAVTVSSTSTVKLSELGYHWRFHWELWLWWWKTTTHARLIWIFIMHSGGPKICHSGAFKKYLSQFTPDINGCIDTSEVISILKQLNTKPTILESELAEFEQVGYKLRLFGFSFEVSWKFCNWNKDVSINGKIQSQFFIKKFIPKKMDQWF